MFALLILWQGIIADDDWCLLFVCLLPDWLFIKCYFRSLGYSTYYNISYRAPPSQVGFAYKQLCWCLTLKTFCSIYIVCFSILTSHVKRVMVVSGAWTPLAISSCHWMLVLDMAGLIVLSSNFIGRKVSSCCLSFVDSQFNRVDPY